MARPASNNINVVIADDHAIILIGLRAYFEDTDIRIVAEAADGSMALAKILSHKPDVAILDLSMPKLTAIDVLKELREKGCEVKVIILTGTTEESSLNEAMELGAKGFLKKDSGMEEIHKAIHHVMEGKTYICPLLAGSLLRKKNDFESSIGLQLLLLTNAEREVLKNLIKNATNTEIAKELHKSVKTVKNHRAHICSKLGLKGSNALLNFAIQNRANLK